MVLAIEADGASYRASGSVRDRDRLRGEHLQRLGWGFHRLWSTNWFQNPQAEVAKLRDAYHRAVAAADPPDAADQPDPRPPATSTRPGRDLDTSGPPGTVSRPGAAPSAAAPPPATPARPGRDLDTTGPPGTVSRPGAGLP
jgi:hypothetical protein